MRTERSLIPVHRGGKWGFLTSKGALAIQPKFSAARDFHEGLAAVCEGGEPTRDGGRVGGNWGYIDASGEYISPLRFDDALNFQEGFGAAMVGSKPKYVPYEGEYYAVGGQWGFVDKQGQWAMPPSLGYVRGFREGLAAASRDGAYGYLDREFQWAIEPTYKTAYAFSEGTAAVCLPEGHWTYLDHQGQQLMEPRFDLAYSFSEGLAAGLDRKEYLYTFLNPSFEETFIAQAGVTHVGAFSEGLIWAILGSIGRFNDGQLYPKGTPNGFGFLNRAGEWVIQPQFEFGTDFSERLACVKTGNRLYGYIRSDGKWAIPPRFTEAEPFQGGFARVEDGGVCAVIDAAGSQLWRAERASVK